MGIVVAPPPMISMMSCALAALMATHINSGSRMRKGRFIEFQSEARSSGNDCALGEDVPTLTTTVAANGLQRTPLAYCICTMPSMPTIVRT